MVSRRRKLRREMFDKFKKTKIYPIILLTVVVLVSVTLLMFLGNITSAVVEERKKAEIVEMLKQIYPEMSDFSLENDIYTVLEGQEEIGHAFLAEGNGYGGVISIIVGLDKDLAVKDISIVSQTETPGLGSMITEDSFTQQFIGLSAQEIELSSSGGKIDSISGATISSEAVTSAVRQAMEEKIKSIK
ncbi:MAG: FMN-binding protein [Actinomycetota bacterium]|nr:FMN-binding protein [Actinomycetota bacterium]